MSILEDITVYSGLICMFVEMFYSRVRRTTEDNFQRIEHERSMREESQNVNQQSQREESANNV